MTLHVRGIFRSLGAAGLLALAHAAHGDVMPKQDLVKGVKDHPMFSRYEGSVIAGHDVKQFDEVRLEAGKRVADSNSGASKFEKYKTVEGKVTRIVYVYPPERSTLDVMRNFEQALDKAGLKPEFTCAKDSCGQYFGDDYYTVLNKSLRVESVGQNAFNYGRGDPRYLLSSGSTSDGVPVTVSVMAVPPKDGQLGGVYLQVVEGKAMDTGKVSVNLNAGDMAKRLVAEGKVAVYGILFDTGKASLKPESKAQLDEMAKLLQSDPTLKVFVVGHTDNVGTYDANLALSRQRAETVAQALVSGAKIDMKRLQAVGAANIAPVANNAQEAGRARNRRVELVVQ
jgi:OmpA-OmpF porin, OOP family